MKVSSVPTGAGQVVVFPGQGSQAAAMGVPWRAHPAWSVVSEAEDVLHRGLSALLLDPLCAPRSTAETQLTVVLCSMVAWRALSTVVPAPLAVAGHSLGLVSALHAAGVLSVADTVRTVALRAAATEQVCRGVEGGMAALMLNVVDTERACAAVQGCWVANDNAPAQTVIAGTRSGLAAATAAAIGLGAGDVVALEVAGPFHTPLMAPAADQFAQDLAEVTFRPTELTVVYNGAVHPPGAAADWRRIIAADLTTPVRWRETQSTLDRLGAGTLIECGYGRTLTGLAKRTIGHLRLMNASNPQAIDGITEFLAEFAPVPR